MTHDDPLHIEGPTRRLGAFVAQIGQMQLDRSVREKAVCCLLDAIGLALQANQELTFLALESLTPDVLGGVFLWANGRRVSLDSAVQANALAVHAQFHDDTDYASWTHPGSLIVPVAVSLAESRAASCETMIRAIVCGYASMSWLGGADKVARALIDRGLRASPVLGGVAAAATASAVLGLDQRRASHAIGMAASMSGGLLEPVRSGSDEWRVQNARAAGAGLLAAQLAEKGVTGTLTGLEGPCGLLTALAGLPALPMCWRDNPDPASILSVVAKPYAALGDNMSAVIAAHLFHAEGVRHNAIRAIRIRIWRHFTEYPGTAFSGPFEQVTQAVASMRFCVAAMLVHGRLDYDIPYRHRQDPDILRLIPLIEIEADDHGTAYDATVVLTLDDGLTTVRHAYEAGDAMLRHDRDYAIALLERRCVQAGLKAGAGMDAAQALWTTVDQTGVSVNAADWIADIWT